MTSAIISDIAAALNVSVQTIYKRIKGEGLNPVEGSYPAKYNIDAIALRKGEAAKIKRHLAKSACKIIPIHPETDKTLEAAEKERQRLAARAQSIELFPRLPLEKQHPAEARAALIAAAERYIREHRLARTAGQNAFVYEYNMGRADVAPWVRDHIRHVAAGTLRDWITAEHNLGLLGLVDCYGNRKDQGTIDTWNAVALKDGTVKAPMADTLVALIIRQPDINEKKANDALRGLLPDAPYVHTKTVRRFMDKWKAKNAQQYAMAQSPDDYKNKLQPAFGSRSEGIDGPNQLWEIDATPADLLLTDGRYKIIGVCDVGPRRLKYYVTKTERARDNAFAIRNCLLDWGVPKNGTIVTDQGSAYIGEHFRRVLRDLDIHQHICNAFSGDEKPHIERSFRTWSHDLIELEIGYCGHSVAERKKIESRKSFAERLMTRGEEITVSLSSAQLQERIDRWLANYHNTVHSSIGKTPNQAVNQWPGSIYRIPDERALDILLAEAVRKGGKLPFVGKKGITIHKITYIHEALYNRVGEQIRAFQDPTDLGRIIVHAMNEHGTWEFLCIAVNPDLAGISQGEVATATRQLHNQHKKEIARLNREAKKELKGIDIVDAVMTYREKAAAEQQGNVSYLPRPTVEYTSPGLQAAGAARAALAGEYKPAAPVISPAVQAMKERMQIEQQQAKATGVVSIQTESIKAKYRRMAAVQQRLENDEDVSVEEFAELRSYKQSNEYRALKGMEEDAQRVVK